MPKPLWGTYRVQFTNHFTFSDAETLVPYWRDLGISHLYASPIFASRAGSQHGYDVVDPTLINPELGGEAAFLKLAQALKDNGLGIILDIVPNHMGIGDPRNAAWLDALEFGSKGPAGAVFDIDWESGPVLIPFLGETLGKTLAAGDIKAHVDLETPRVGVVYFDHVLPFRPETVAKLIEEALPLSRSGTMDQARKWGWLDSGVAADALEKARESLKELLADSDLTNRLATVISAKLEEAGSDQRAARALFDDQHWRLANWHLAKDEINYRRFFNISDLAALQAELPTVFQTTHELPLRLLKAGIVDGLRVDHVDGLSDPAAYCQRLRQAAGDGATLHVEKILDREETLRPWPIDGTTGYELLNLINNLFIDSVGYRALQEHAHKNRTLAGSIGQRVAAAKRKVLTESFVAELTKLARVAKKLADRDLDTRDFSLEAIRNALEEMIVRFPIYRSYLSGVASQAEDIKLIKDVSAAACSHLDSWHQSAVRFLEATLLADTESAVVTELKRRFQQLTSPVMAKGYEDTELYRYVVLISVNEVGGQIAEPAISSEEFHKTAAYQQKNWPRALVPLATHDTKRGAGARARINVLSECSGPWAEAVNEWSKLNQSLKTEIDGELIPGALDEQLIYQALLGSWPVTSERLLQYLSKAIREAKLRTSWENPDARYEEAISSFAKALIDNNVAEPFRRNFQDFIAPIVKAGRINSLAQTLVQFTFPGVPDLYWGNEFWDLSMVDPDNRRPVDWADRQYALAQSSNPITVERVADDEIGVTKLKLIHALLKLRQSAPELLTFGAYHPLTVEGDDGRWLAYARGTQEQGLVVVVPLRGLDLLNNGVSADPSLELPAAWAGSGQEIISGKHVTLLPQRSLTELLGNRGFAAISFGKTIV